MPRYANKNVVIVGGTSGMGLATARHLEQEGAAVVVTGRTAANVQIARDRLGGDTLVLAGDVSRRADIDALFLSTGIARNTSIQDTSEAIYDEVFDVNTRGAYFTLRGLAPLMREGGGIVLATSVSNVKGLPNNSVYAASKAALRSMTRTFARELLSQGVRVNAVSPGPIDTGILDRSMAPEEAQALKAQMAANNPMGRFGTPDEIAAAVAFLAFEATFTTGAELAVDGGVSQLL